jgi:predicted RNA-binding protein Jag
MKPDLLTAEVTVNSYRQHHTDCLNRGVRRLISWVHQAGRPATTPPRKHNERRVLHDFFKQNPGPESRAKDHEGDRRVVVLQKRG